MLAAVSVNDDLVHFITMFTLLSYFFLTRFMILHRNELSHVA